MFSSLLISLVAAQSSSDVMSSSMMVSPSPSMSSMMPTPSSSVQNLGSGDLSVLNLALVLEELESAFYDNALSMFNETDFTNAGFPNGTLEMFQEIQGHEHDHVTALNDTIQKYYPGMQVTPCQYNFSTIANATVFVNTAMSIENLGVQAYLGQVKLISNKDYLESAASIMDIEARHASFLNSLEKMSPFPASFEMPMNKSDVLKAAGAFISSCPFALENSDEMTTSMTTTTMASGSSENYGGIFILSLLPILLL